MNINSIKQKVRDEISGARVEVVDTTGTGDHFSILVVSDIFNKMTLINRHKLIYQSLDKYVTKEIHALQIKAYTEEEFTNE